MTETVTKPKLCKDCRHFLKDRSDFPILGDRCAAPVLGSSLIYGNAFTRPVVDMRYGDCGETGKFFEAKA